MDALKLLMDAYFVIIYMILIVAQNVLMDFILMTTMNFAMNAKMDVLLVQIIKIVEDV